MSGRRIIKTGELVPFAEDMSDIPCSFKSRPPKDLDETKKVVVCTICNLKMCYTSLQRHRKSISHLRQVSQTQTNS